MDILRLELPTIAPESLTGVANHLMHGASRIRQAKGAILYDN
jgi:hypothetical protein